MNHMGFKDRVVVITGAGTGIGYSCACEFARAGAKVIIAEWDESLGKAAESRIKSEGLSAEYINVDVTSEQSVNTLFMKVRARYGYINVLVNNVGHFQEQSILGLDLESWNKEMSLNLGSVFLCCKYAIPLLVKSKDNKAVVNISSNLGTIAEPASPAYCTAKAGLNMLTKCLALEYASDAVRFVAVAPGPVGRPEEFAIQAPVDPEEEEYSLFNPLGRFATPEEVAGMVLFVASEKASYMTGTVVALDGGETANPVSWSILKKVKETGSI